MSDAILRYTEAEPHELEPGECTVRRTRWRPDRAPQLRLVACVRDEVGADVGALVLISVGIAPGGEPVETGDAWTRTWSLYRAGPGNWLVRPSIDVRDVWHHTPLIVGVPEPPPWERA